MSTQWSWRDIGTQVECIESNPFGDLEVGSVYTVDRTSNALMRMPIIRIKEIGLYFPVKYFRKIESNKPCQTG